MRPGESVPQKGIVGHSRHEGGNRKHVGRSLIEKGKKERGKAI